MAVSVIYPRGKLNDPQASWVERFLARLFVREEIPTRTEPTRLYLRRFKIFDPRRKDKPGENPGKKGAQGKSWFPWGRIYLHFFYASDLDPDPHCHPWSFLTIPLWGKGYHDETWRELTDEHGMYEGVEVVKRPLVKPGTVAFRRASHIHRVQLVDPDKRTVTLVISGPRGRKWWFYTATGKVWGPDYKGAAMS